MDWLQVASGLGFGGAAGALIGVLAAAKTARNQFEDLGKSLKKAKPENIPEIVNQLVHLGSTFGGFLRSIDQVGRKLRKN